MKRVLLDGGMGQELLKRWKKPAHPLWSVKIMMDAPELVQAVHEDYIKAGARVITVNSYIATPERLSREGVAELFATLQKKAIDLANAARDAVGIDVDIAGCLPPLHGSYKPDLDRSQDFLFEKYIEIANEQKENVDLIICETMASIAEASAATRAAQNADLDVWTAFTLDDDHIGKLRSGEDIKDAISTVKSLNPNAILYNCSRPETIEASLHLLEDVKTYGAYANGFTHIGGLKIGGTVNDLTAREDLTPEKYAQSCAGWLLRGAQIIGGCCETSPAHIEELYKTIATSGDRITSWRQ